MDIFLSLIVYHLTFFSLHYNGNKFTFYNLMVQAIDAQYPNIIRPKHLFHDSIHDWVASHLENP